MIVGTIKMNPINARRSLLKIYWLSLQKLRANAEQPLPERLRLRVNPTPRSIELAGQLEVGEHIVVPVRQPIRTKSKDCLKRIAKHSRRQRLRGPRDDDVLAIEQS